MTNKPYRVQRKRTKGWRMPPNTVSVCRHGKWGNPFEICKAGPLDRIAPDALSAVGFSRDMLADSELRAVANYPTDLSPLKGKNLACFCPLDSQCHADVLLEIAND